VVHGEGTASEALADGLRSLGVGRVIVPHLGDEFVE
jgi:hypothetical protein